MNREQIQGDWTPEESELHINVQKMMAVRRKLEYFKDQLQGKTVLVSTDNSTVVAYVRKQGGTRSRTLHSLAQELWYWAQENKVNLKCRHIPGRLNVVADQLSRAGEILPNEWAINNRVLDHLWCLWEKPMIDLFATHYNNKMDLYVSPIPDQKAWGVDAFSLSWDEVYGYMFPPTAILGKVLSKISQSQCKMVVIAPKWPKQAWYSQILELMVELPIAIPTIRKLLKQPQSDVFHRDWYM